MPSDPGGSIITNYFTDIFGEKQSQEVLLPVTSGETAQSPPDGPVATGDSYSEPCKARSQSHRDLGSHPAPTLGAGNKTHMVPVPVEFHPVGRKTGARS